LLVIEPSQFGDKRGHFRETYQKSRYFDAGILDDFVQDNHSHSKKGVLRGLHFQVNHPQAQLLTVISGRIFDVCVDLRPQSSTFSGWYGVYLSSEAQSQIYMPPGFAHGFYVLSDIAELHYKVSRAYDAQDEGGLLWSDPDIGIEWPINGDVVMGPRDESYPALKDVPKEKLPHL
jgi:dTDP-4-dehydrorhamnose 3,5-epimerase